MKITWLGTASLRIESGDTAILVDPYLQPRGVNRGALMKGLDENVAAVLITHPHFDHFHGINKVLEILEQTRRHVRRNIDNTAQCPKSSAGEESVPVYVCKKGIDTANSCGYPVSCMKAVKPGDTLTFGHMRVRVHQGRHVKYDFRTVSEVIARALKNRQVRQALGFARLNRIFPIGEKDIFIYEIVCDKISKERIVILGSAGDLPPTRSLKGADLLVFPYAGRADMSAYAWNLIRSYEPKRVLFHHFDDAFPPLTKEMDFREIMAAASASVWAPELVVPGIGDAVEL